MPLSSWAESQSRLQRYHPCKLSSSAPQRCELHLYNTTAINCMFNKKPGLAGTFWRAGIGVPATCDTSLAQEQCKSHNWIIKTSMAHGRWDATADLKVFGSQLSSQRKGWIWRFPNPHPSAAITSHRHLTWGLNSVYKIKQQVKSCTWECHYLADSSRPKLPILHQSREMWCLSYTPATSTQHFLAAGREQQHPGMLQLQHRAPFAAQGGFSPQEALLLMPNM